MGQIGPLVTLISRVPFLGLVFKQQCLYQVRDLQIHSLTEGPAVDRAVSRGKKRIQDCPTEINLRECFAKPSKRSYICCCMQNTGREGEGRGEGRGGRAETTLHCGQIKALLLSPHAQLLPPFQKAPHEMHMVSLPSSFIFSL